MFSNLAPFDMDKKLDKLDEAKKKKIKDIYDAYQE